jgi:hypothetical protein
MSQQVKLSVVIITFNEQRNIARCIDSVLSVADEVVVVDSFSPDDAFLDQIKHIKQNWAHDGYSVNRLNNYCGKWIRHGAWYPDIKLRLWDSRIGKWAGSNPHDKYEMEEGSSIKHVPGDLLHFSYQTIEEHLKKSEYFSTIAANAYYKNGKRSSLFKIYASPMFRFTRDFIFKLGFLDGKYGFYIAKIIAKEVYLKYKKLYQLQKS